MQKLDHLPTQHGNQVHLSFPDKAENNKQERLLHDFVTGVFFWKWKMMILDANKTGHIKRGFERKDPFSCSLGGKS